MKPIDIGLIQARRAKIEAEIAAETTRFEKIEQEHKSRLLDLEAELQELSVAERVFAKLTKEISGTELEMQEAPTTKPDDAPTVPEMVREALKHAKELGSPGLKPAEILSFIQGKWWPSAVSNQVGPVVWRMGEKGFLLKRRDGIYSLPPEHKERQGEAASPP